MMQGFMPPDAFTFDTSGQLVMQTAIGGAGTLFGPLVGAAVWLYLQRLPADDASPRRRVEAGPRHRLRRAGHASCAAASSAASSISARGAPDRRPRRGAGVRPPSWRNGRRVPRRVRRRTAPLHPAAQGIPGQASSRSWRRRGLSKRYGGVVANDDIDFMVHDGEIRGLIGPNGAGKSTFFKMLTGEIHADGGPHRLRGPGHHRPRRHEVCQLGLTKSYQVNQLFTQSDGARQPDDRRAVAERAGPFRLDLLHADRQRERPRRERSRRRCALVDLDGARRRAGVGARLRRKAAARDRPGARHRLRACCCSTSRSPA